jgi:hypothetical protein
MMLAGGRTVHATTSLPSIAPGCWMLEIALQVFILADILSIRSSVTDVRTNGTRFGPTLVHEPGARRGQGQLFQFSCFCASRQIIIHDASSAADEFNVVLGECETPGMS